MIYKLCSACYDSLLLALGFALCSKTVCRSAEEYRRWLHIHEQRSFSTVDSHYSVHEGLPVGKRLRVQGLRLSGARRKHNRLDFVQYMLDAEGLARNSASCSLRFFH